MMQVKNAQGEWIDIGDIKSGGVIQYRVKPEKRPDIVATGAIIVSEDGFMAWRLHQTQPNIRCTFSRDTGKLIKAEVLE